MYVRELKGESEENVDIAKVVEAVVEVVNVALGGKFGRFLTVEAWEASRPRGGISR